MKLAFRKAIDLLCSYIYSKFLPRVMYPTFLYPGARKFEWILLTWIPSANYGLGKFESFFQNIISESAVPPTVSVAHWWASHAGSPLTPSEPLLGITMILQISCPKTKCAKPQVQWQVNIEHESILWSASGKTKLFLCIDIGSNKLLYYHAKLKNFRYLHANNNEIKDLAESLSSGPLMAIYM